MGYLGSKTHLNPLAHHFPWQERHIYSSIALLNVPITGSEYVLPASVAIIGLGTTANPLIQSTTPDLATNKRNYIVTDTETMRTSKRGVFAGGDIVTGSATVILAMGAGRKAAASIHEYLTSGAWEAVTQD